MTLQDRLDERYGRRNQRGGRVLLVVLVVLLLGVAGWFAWALWVNVNPKVTSGSPKWIAQGQNQVEVWYDVRVHDHSITPTCSVEASDENGAVVGRLQFHPAPGQGSVTFRTERDAARVTWDGCTAPGQRDAR